MEGKKCVQFPLVFMLTPCVAKVDVCSQSDQPTYKVYNKDKYSAKPEERHMEGNSEWFNGSKIGLPQARTDEVCFKSFLAEIKGLNHDICIV